MNSRNDLRAVLIEALTGAADALRRGYELDEKPARTSDREAPNEPAMVGGRATLSVVDAAEILGIGRSAAYALIQSGELPSLHIGRRRLVPVKALLDLLENTAPR